MKPISLNGKWKLYWRTQENQNTPRLTDFSKLQNIDAMVPGNVEIDLQKAGILPDIYFANNIYQVKPYEFAEWWYLRTFKASKQLVDNGADLVFAGLDCFADIWLNGRLLGSTANMFIEHRFNITDVLAPGDNQLIVHIKSAVLEGRKHKHDVCEAALPVSHGSLSVRKAPHMFGWDIMPRLVSAGIWRDVTIQPHKDHRIIEAYYFTKQLKREPGSHFANICEMGSLPKRQGKGRLGTQINSAELCVKYRFGTSAYDLSQFLLRISGRCGNSKFTKTIKPYHTFGQTDIFIKNPRLWWPKGYGRPNLYRVEVELLHNGQMLDRRTENIGIRQIKLDYTEINTKDKPGKFLFICNDIPIMVKGTNHVPLDALHSRDAKRLGGALELLDDLGCNMIRCWGGSLYEDHPFFDFCDFHGIMVWQDFAFACAFYPQTDEFQKIVAAEAESVIRKLRNHPSIAVWAGDNEVDSLCIYFSGTDPGQNRLTRQTLPKVVARCDPHRSFLPSSPYYGPQVVAANDPDLAPEQHLWGPRDYYKRPFYSQNNACFASEIGYHGCPNISSIKKFISPDKLWPWQNNSQWFTHCTNPDPDKNIFRYRVKLMADQIYNLFGFRPKNLREFVLASQITQAEANKYFIELFRSAKWRKSGILWWNLIDGWPQFSDAVVDYYFSKKLAYYYIKRVQTDVCLMVTDPEDGHCAVIAANDTLKRAAGSFKLWDADTGKILLKERFNVDVNVNKTLAKIKVNPNSQCMFLIDYNLGKQKFGNHYMLGKPPFSFRKYYQKWLKQISALPGRFDYRQVGGLSVSAK